MSKKPVINYLSIQLRDMDYDNYYPSSIDKRFLDSNDEKNYNMHEIYQEGFEKAYQVAWNTLGGYLDAQQKIRYKSLPALFRTLFNSRLEKEKKFILEWIKYNSGNKKIIMNDKQTQILDSKKQVILSFPSATDRMPSEEAAFKYATAFSEIINGMTSDKLNDEDKIVVEALRSNIFIESISGKNSAVYSSRASENAQKAGAKAKHQGQSIINSYYEELFSIFCIGEPTGSANVSKLKGEFNISTALMTLTNDKAARVAFRLKFKQFIDKYYPEISPKISMQLLGRIQNQCFDSIYKNFKGKGEKDIITIYAQTSGRGMSEKNQTQLKKMFLETFRQISSKSGGKLSYEDLSIPGLLEINESWEFSGDMFHKALQMKITNKSGTGLLDQFKKSTTDDRWNQNMRGKKGFEGFVDFYFDWIFKRLNTYSKSHYNQELSNNVKDKLKRAAISTLKKRTWGSKMIENLQAYGPGQVKGLMGEIAAAYELQVGGRMSTQITGAQKSSSGTGQVHYDVQARIKRKDTITTIGFQVKNFTLKDGKQSGFYATSLGLGTQNMKRYFSDQEIISYRWLFANGKFLEGKKNSPKFQNLKNRMALSMLSAVPYFLRIGDAANGDIDGQFNSDVYIIGNYYYPASYLVAKAYYSVAKNYAKTKQFNNLITIDESFPDYAKKYVSVKHGTRYYQKKDANDEYQDTDRLRTKTKFINSDKKTTSYSKDNLIYIDQHLKKLASAKINFSGITISFKI